MNLRKHRTRTARNDGVRVRKHATSLRKEKPSHPAAWGMRWPTMPQAGPLHIGRTHLRPMLSSGKGRSMSPTSCNICATLCVCAPTFRRESVRVEHRVARARIIQWEPIMSTPSLFYVALTMVAAAAMLPMVARQTPSLGSNSRQSFRGSARACHTARPLRSTAGATRQGCSLGTASKIF